jgi:hypothetical protein
MQCLSFERTEWIKRDENVPTVSARKIKAFPSRGGMGRQGKGEEEINLLSTLRMRFKEEEEKKRE